MGLTTNIAAVVREPEKELLTPPAVKPPVLDKHIEGLRYLAACARHPALRGTRMRLGRGAQLMLAKDARLDVAPGFSVRRDLTLVVQGSLRVGQSMFCNRGVLLAAMHQITIGDWVRLGERVSVIDANHVIEPLADADARFRDYTVAPVTIGDRVLVGANCVVLPGATIGDDAVIAAGSVVRGEIPAGALAAGVPAVVKRSLD
jgi:acetyltransferase-like isoleucine patch superfamily enzyme